MDALDALQLLYQKARVIEHNGTLTTINAFTDQCEPLDPVLLANLAELVCNRLPVAAFDLILGEEDKGAHIATAVALRSTTPFSLARWYLYPLEQADPNSIVVDVVSEYYRGALLVNGVRPGMNVVIIDDTISTGGTLIGMIRAVSQRGAAVIAAVAVVEKVESSGVDRVKAETGVHVDTLLKIRTTREGVEVLRDC